MENDKNLDENICETVEVDTIVKVEPQCAVAIVGPTGGMFFADNNVDTGMAFEVNRIGSGYSVTGDGLDAQVKINEIVVKKIDKGYSASLYGGSSMADTFELNDTDDGSVRILYNCGDGKDVVRGFNADTDNVSIYKDSGVSSSVMSSVVNYDGKDLKLKLSVNDADVLTLENVNCGDKKILSIFDVNEVEYKMALGDGGTFEYVDDVEIYKNVSTLKVSQTNKDRLILSLNSKASGEGYGCFDKLTTKIDASECNAELVLVASDVDGSEIRGGTNLNYLNGAARSSQILVGNDLGVDIFCLCENDGQDYAENVCCGQDAVWLKGVDDINTATVEVVSGTNAVIRTTDGSSLDMQYSGNFEDLIVVNKAGAKYNYNVATCQFTAVAK